MKNPYNTVEGWVKGKGLREEEGEGEEGEKGKA